MAIALRHGLLSGGYFLFLAQFDWKDTFMTQAEMNREVAAATGESVSTISKMGFSPLTPVPYERDREPLVVDWDDLADRRAVLHPV